MIINKTKANGLASPFPSHIYILSLSMDAIIACTHKRSFYFVVICGINEHTLEVISVKVNTLHFYDG